MVKILAQLTAVGGWIVAVLMLWHRSFPMAIALATTGGLVIFWSIRRSWAEAHASLPPGEAEKHGRLLVTRMLRTLTKVQVAYLCQKFDNDDEGRDWLRRTLPKSFRSIFDKLLADLQHAARGGKPEALALALRVLELRPKLDAAQDVLHRAHDKYPKHAVASPVVFVITENIDGTQHVDPLVVTLASIDPQQPSLVPSVDVLSFFTDIDGQKRIRGHTDFEAAQRAMADNLVPLGDEGIFVSSPVELDDAQLRLSKPPLGFVISGAEFA